RPSDCCWWCAAPARGPLIAPWRRSGGALAFCALSLPSVAPHELGSGRIVTMSLLDEIQQRNPFASLEEEALLNLWRTYEVLARAGEELFKQHRITAKAQHALRV